MCYNGTFFGEAFYMFGFLAQEWFRDQQREVSIYVACFLEHIVEDTLHLFPNCISVRLDHHTAAYCRILCQIRFDYQILVPLRVVHTSRSQFFCHFLIILMFFSIDSKYDVQRYKIELIIDNWQLTIHAIQCVIFDKKQWKRPLLERSGLLLWIRIILICMLRP